MNGLVGFLERSIVPIAAKIGSQKHLVAIRDAFIGLMPVTMAGSFAVLLNVFLRDLPNEWWGAGNGVTTAFAWLIGMNGHVWQGSLAIFAILFALSLGYNIAKAYDVDPLSGALVSLSAFIMGLPAVATIGEEAGWGFFNFAAHFGARGLFTVLLIGFLSVIIFCKFMQWNITIKMPESVPPAVSKAFAAIIPGAVALYVAALVYYLFGFFTDGESLIEWIIETIQAPLMGLSQGYGAVLVIVLLVHLFWFFGLHGANIMQAILQPLYGAAGIENANAFEMGAEIPFQWVAGSFDAFVWPGGSGATLLLLVAILVFSKRSDYKMVGKLGIGPGVFNINEPVMFGLPVVLNPLLLVPFVLAPVAMATIAYAATMLGWVDPVVVPITWVMPVGISGFLATAGDWRSIILSLVNVAVGLIIYIPFVIAANSPKLGGDAQADQK